jgi:predicted ester cyclase
MMGMPPTGRAMEVMGISLFQVVDGKVAWEWEGFDTMGMMQQLGLVPAAA